MIHFLLVILLFFSPVSLAADYIRVIKVKGRKGIVKFPPGSNYKKGDQIRIDSGVWQERGLDGNGLRRYSISGSLSFGQTNNSSKASGVTTKTELGGVESTFQFGFNKRDYEFGPEVSYLISKVDDEQTTTVSMGGFYYYNFLPNKPGAVFVPFAGGSLRLLSQDADSVKRDGVGASIKGGVRWFPINDHVCAIGELVFDYASLNSENVESTATGFTVRAGVGSYF